MSHDWNLFFALEVGAPGFVQTVNPNITEVVLDGGDGGEEDLFIYFWVSQQSCFFLYSVTGTVFY